jgi:hypothetical protein
MDLQTIIALAVIVAVVIMVIVVLMAVQSRRVNLTRPAAPDQKPDWLSTNPPAETVAATQADGEGVTLFDQDAGEKIAPPFAEQIEDVLQARLQADPALAHYKVDFGTAPDGSLEIWVDGKSFVDIAAIPDTHLRETIQQAIAQWQKNA